MPAFEHDGLTFNYFESGEGTPFVYQHGLGGDLNQTREVYRSQPGIRFVSFDARAHGETRPVGSVEKLRFEQFADDLLALIDYLELQSVVVGGISMGAGIALNFAIRYPERVRGLVLSRPAWLDTPRPPNLDIMVQVGRLIQQYGASQGRRLFEQSEAYAALRRNVPDVADALLRLFEHPRAEETVAKLECLPNDRPTLNRADWSAIQVRTLILANHADPLHPFEYGILLAQAIPSATLKELTSKSVDRPKHVMEAQNYVAEFLEQFIP